MIYRFILMDTTETSFGSFNSGIVISFCINRSNEPSRRGHRKGIRNTYAVPI